MYFDCVNVSRRTAHARCTKCGSKGGRSGCIPASSGSRFPLRVLQPEHAVSTLAHAFVPPRRSEEHTSELQSPCNLVCRLLLEKKKTYSRHFHRISFYFTYVSMAGL